METLVFVHGYLGGSGQWAEQSRVFSTPFRVITPDLPGYGLNCDLEAPETISAFADYVLHMVESAGVEQFHLVGHSMGGMVAQEMAARAPERIDRLVLYGTGPVGLLPGRFETIAESRRRISKDGAATTGRRIAATWFVDGDCAENYFVCADLAAKASQQAAIGGLAAMETWSGEQALKHISSPTLVVWGDCDRTYTWNQVQRLWQGIEKAQLAVIPGCAHAAHLEKPELFNAVLADFLLCDKSDLSRS